MTTITSSLKREDLITIEKKDGIATIWLDKKGEKQNTISMDFIPLFEDSFDEVLNDPEIRAVVVTSAKKDFIAGADVASFTAEKPGDFQPFTRRGHQILKQIETSSKPVVAAIQGACFGLGLEIALACAGRIISDDRSTKLGLPEVKLGLLPGGGGTQRLPRLVGIQKALDIMLTGKNIYARPAYKMGLADRMVHKSKLLRAAREFALEIANNKFERKSKLDTKDKLLEGTSFGRSVIFNQARKMVQKTTSGNYPAPFEIIKCVEVGMEQGIEAGLAEEIVRFEKLMLTPESRQLRHIFFNMTNKKKNPMADKVKEVECIAMLGAGFMGAGITEVSITNDIDVILKDINEDTIASAKKLIWKSFSKKVKRKAMGKVEAERLIGEIKGQLDYSGFKRPEIVIEAVFEDLDLKQRVLAEVEAATSDDCIFASNTSALPISAIAEKSTRPELIIGMHYFSPVPKMPLLEIVKTDKTADWVIATCLDIGIRQGKTCIVVKDGPGFYTTRILAPFMNEALLMLEEGAKIKDIDRAMKDFGYPVGPITLMDEVGIDVGAHIMSGDLIKLFIAQREDVKISEAIMEMSKMGYKGRKNQKGFYKYDAKTKKKGEINEEVYMYFGGDERREMDKQTIQRRCALVMVNEAAMCLQEGIIANPTDGDVGAIFGIGFPPFRGGPFRYVDQLGASKVVKRLEKLAERFGGRFKPADILVEYAKEGKKFYK